MSLCINKNLNVVIVINRKLFYSLSEESNRRFMTQFRFTDVFYYFCILWLYYSYHDNRLQIQVFRFHSITAVQENASQTRLVLPSFAQWQADNSFLPIILTVGELFCGERDLIRHTKASA